MRKLLAFLLVASMLATVALCAFAVSAAEPTNVALGKKYVTSALHRQGEFIKDDGTKDWGWVEDAPISYPDEGGTELTDGILPVEGATYSDPAFFGFAAGTPETEELGYAYMRVDLEETYALTKLVLYVGTKALGAGLGVPETVTFLKVDDMNGANPEELGTVIPEDSETEPCAPAELETEVSARYIEIRVTRGWSWMHIAEFEAYAAEGGNEPDEPKEPEIVEVEEVIEVDGDLTDTGWVKAEWNTHNLYQQADAARPEDRTAKFAVRTDADNIYVAAEIVGTIAPNILDDYAETVAGGLEANGAQTTTYAQTGASSFRIWLRTNDDERYLIDVQYLGEELGWTATRTIYPAGSELTWNDLADKIDIAVVYADGTVTAEFAIDKAAYGVEDEFRMFISYWDNYTDLVDENNEKAYQVIHVCNEDAVVNENGVIKDYSQAENHAAYITFADEDVVLGTYEMTVGGDEPEPEPEDTYEDDIAALVGEPLEDPDFVIDLTNTVEGNVVTVTLTVKDIKEGVLMQALTAQLFYDAERLTLTNEINKDKSVKCDTALPYGDDSTWENLTKAGDGVINISFIVADEPDQYIDAEHPIVLTFTFELAEGYDKAGVYVPTSSVESLYAPDDESSSTTTYHGNGAYTIAKAVVEEPSSSSSESTPETKPGDNGILVFAVLGILAIAGVATVVKVRH